MYFYHFNIIFAMKKVETQEHVQAFLNLFLPKFDIWGIFFINRKKNDEAIAALGITPAQRDYIIRNIEINDYIETIVDEMSFGDMWVFGKDVSGEELYIKISLGRPNSNTICISFHRAEFPNRYAFKKERK